MSDSSLQLTALAMTGRSFQDFNWETAQRELKNDCQIAGKNGTTRKIIMDARC